MNRRQIALKLVLAELGIRATMESFDDRLILQKAVYLAQQAGIPLGYHYYWYLRGPYSRELTADAFATLTEAPAGWSLDQRSKRKLAKLKTFFREFKSGSSKVRAFEMFASVLFAVVTGQAQATNAAGITKLMRTAGKNFTEKEVNAAVQRLRDQGLLPTV
ncbi:MAG: hypothetical protein KDM81_01410 [Verrucomicrobiae bacterium]|nr:hypothetical protein [Verrucomicrobiae bacterium]